MTEINFERGDYVTYWPPYRDKGEKGRVKRVDTEGFVYVVFDCADNWEYYYKYTAQLTPVQNLYRGWIDDRPAEVARTFTQF